MIHKRNLTITALVWAAIITIAFLIFPKIYHGPVGGFYFPSVALAVIFSQFFGGNPHSPSNVSGWSAFGVYTLLYWVVFLIVYVILLEFCLLQRVLRHYDDVKQNLTSDKPDSKMALDRMGQAIVELETRRRKHFLLKPLDLPEFPANQRYLLAAHVMTKAGSTRPAKALLKKLNKKVAASSNAEKAAVLLGKLKGDAAKLLAENSGTKQDGGDKAGA